jgi:hypothetical protein
MCKTELKAPSVEDLGNLNISLSRSGSLALFDLALFSFLGLVFEGLGIFERELAGVVERTKDGVNGSGGRVLLRLVLEMFKEHEVRGTGTLKLDDLDCLPPDIKIIPGDFGSGVREIDTPDMNNVGDFGMPVSDSYSFELSVSRV